MAYGAVDRQTWNDEKFRSWGRDTRDVWLYLLTCPHGNRIGCFVLDPLYVASDVQIEIDRARECLRKLDTEDRIVWDPEARVVCIKRHLHPDYNPLANESVAKAAAKDVKGLPESPRALQALASAVEKWGRSHYSPLKEALSHRVDTVADTVPAGCGTPSSRVDQDQDHDQDPDPDPEAAPARPRGADRLAEFLGDHAPVVDAFHDTFGEDSSTWALAVLGHYGPNGTKEDVWQSVPPSDRPTLLAAAMWSYIGDADEYDNRLFRRYLDRQVHEYWEAGESEGGDLSAADEKIIEFRRELEHVDLSAAR